MLSGLSFFKIVKKYYFSKFLTLIKLHTRDSRFWIFRRGIRKNLNLPRYRSRKFSDRTFLSVGRFCQYRDWVLLQLLQIFHFISLIHNFDCHSNYLNLIFIKINCVSSQYFSLNICILEQHLSAFHFIKLYPPNPYHAVKIYPRSQHKTISEPTSTD